MGVQLLGRTSVFTTQVWEGACPRWLPEPQYNALWLTSRRKRHHPLVLSLAVRIADNPERLFPHRLPVQERIDLGVSHAM